MDAYELDMAPWTESSYRTAPEKDLPLMLCRSINLMVSVRSLSHVRLPLDQTPPNPARKADSTECSFLEAHCLTKNLLDPMGDKVDRV